MTLAADRSLPGPDTVDTFESVDPGTGEVLATYPAQSAEDVARAVARAREAARWWQQQGWDGRR